MQGSERTGKLRKALAFAGRLASILILSGILVLSDDQRAAIAQALSNPLAVIEGRSPGARDGAKLRQTKQRKRISPISEELFDRDFAISPEALEPDTDIFTENAESPLVPPPTAHAPEGEGEQALAGTPTDMFAHGHGGVWGGGGSGGGGFFEGTSGGPGGGGGNEGGPGGGGGGGGGGNCNGEACGVPTGGTDTPTTIPVPEPSTWLLIIAGFMALGGALRGLRIKQANPAATGKRAA